MSKLISWDNVMDQSLKIPGMKINRDEFLKEAFLAYGKTDLLTDNRPIDLYNEDAINQIAADAINKHLRITSATSTAAGIPGGFAMLGTVPADLAQFYGHVLVLSQKLGYIYGWPDLLDENQKVTDGTRNILTLFVGVMFGAQTANKAVTELGKNFSIQIVKRLPQQALTKTIYYPVIKEVGKWIGVKITKDVFAKGVGKVIPILGGVISGGITYVSFNSMSKKLQNQLQKEMLLQPKQNINSFSQNFNFATENNVDANKYDNRESEQNDDVNLEHIRISACINMAKIDFNLDQNEIEFLTTMIEESDLASEKQMELLEYLHKKEIEAIDFKILRSNTLFSLSLLESLTNIIHADSEIKPSEKIYLYKIGNELGFTKDEVSEFLLSDVEN